MVNANVHERSKGSDIRYYSRKPHAWTQIFDFFYPFCKSEIFKLFSWITARPGQFGKDILERGHSHLVCQIFGKIYLSPACFVFKQILHRTPQVFGHGLHNTIGFGMHCAGVKRVFAVSDTKKSCGLFKGLWAKTGHIFEFLS